MVLILHRGLWEEYGMRTPARIMIMLLIAAALVSSALLYASAAPAAAPAEVGSNVSGSAVLLKLFPEIGNLYAPGWLKEGLRVYYRTSSGKLGKSESQAVEKLSDVRLQKPEDISVNPFLVRTDITGISGKLTASFSTVFIDLVNLPWDDSSDVGPSGMGSFWIHPDLIKPSAARPGLVMSATKWKILDQDYDAVMLSYGPTDQPDEYYVWIVEKSTGLLLYSAKITRSKPGGEVEINAVEFYSMRYVTLPWSATSLPQFAKAGFTLTYDGNLQTWNPKTGPGLSIPALMQVKIDKVDQKLIYASISRIYSEREAYDSDIFIGTAQIGGSYWLPQGIIPKLREGQVLDKDPVTNTVLEVSYIGVAKDGTSRIGIFEFGKNYKRAWVFRSNDGLLVYWMEDKVIDPVSGVSQKAEWTLK
jgi:hypothetical protein